MNKKILELLFILKLINFKIILGIMKEEINIKNLETFAPPLITKCTECNLKFNFVNKHLDKNIYCQCSISWLLPKNLEKIYLETNSSHSEFLTRSRLLQKSHTSSQFLSNFTYSCDELSLNNADEVFCKVQPSIEINKNKRTYDSMASSSSCSYAEPLDLPMVVGVTKERMNPIISKLVLEMT